LSVVEEHRRCPETGNSIGHGSVDSSSSGELSQDIISCRLHITLPEAVRRMPRVPTGPDALQPSHIQRFQITPAVLLSPIFAVLDAYYFIFLLSTCAID
jgi:hypothetical protein